MSDKIAEKIKTAREAIGMNQKELAEKIGVTGSAVSRWENGEVNNIGRSKLEALCKILNIKPSSLIFEDEPVKEQYFYDDETAALARELHQNPRMRVLMSASRKTTPKELEAIIALVENMTDD